MTTETTTPFSIDGLKSELNEQLDLVNTQLRELDARRDGLLEEVRRLKNALEALK